MANTIKYLFGLILGVALFFALGYFYHARTGQQTNVITYKSDSLVFIDSTNHNATHNHFHITNVYQVGIKDSSNHIKSYDFIIDTAEIIRKYFTVRFVTDTIRNDTLLFVINDTLFNNKITSRKTQYRLLQPYKTIITNTISIPSTVSQNGFYLGTFLGFHSSQVQSVGVEANYVTHKLNYGLGYDFKNNAVTGKLLLRLNKK